MSESDGIDFGPRAEQRLTTALENGEGYKRADGRWVDPYQFQKVLIEEGFRKAAEVDDFDIWTVVDERTLRRDRTLDENFQSVYDVWEDRTGDIAEEVRAQLQAMGYTLEDER